MRKIIGEIFPLNVGIIGTFWYFLNLHLSIEYLIKDWNRRWVNYIWSFLVKRHKLCYLLSFSFIKLVLIFRFVESICVIEEGNLLRICNSTKGNGKAYTMSYLFYVSALINSLLSCLNVSYALSTVTMIWCLSTVTMSYLLPWFVLLPSPFTLFTSIPKEIIELFTRSKYYEYTLAMIIGCWIL